MGCAASKETGPLKGGLATRDGPPTVTLAAPLAGKGSTAPAAELSTQETAVKKAAVTEEAAEATPDLPVPISVADPSILATMGAEEEERRLNSLLACRMLDTPPERRFDTICTLLQSIFQVPIAVVGLIDSDRLYLKSLVGSQGSNAKRIHSFCDASLKAPNPTMMIVPDTMQDARFTHNEFVNTPPFVRFYCGAPLISSEGYVMGSLGLMDIKPRSFPAELCNVICNFAELVVRELERDKAEAQLQEQRSKEKEETEHLRRQLVARETVGAVRALSVFDEAVLLCDASQEGWPLLYCNDSWCKLSGFDEAKCMKSTFAQLFAGQAERQLIAAQMAIQDRRPFYINVTLGDSGRHRLRFRPATKDHIGNGADIPLIGIPPFMKSATQEELAELPTGYYFAVVEGLTEELETPEASEAQLRISTSTTLNSGSTYSGVSTPRWSVKSFDLEAPPSLGDVSLGPMLGSGAHGRVYRGSWQDKQVAVKIMDSWLDPQDWTTDPSAPHTPEAREALTGPALEAALSQDLVHPNLVRTFDHAFNRDKVETAASDGSGSDDDSQAFVTREHCQFWIIEEYCTHGTLLDAVDRGWLRSKRALDGPVDMKALLTTAKDIVSGLAFLHSNSVLHGDLSGNNVLLASAPEDPRGFVAKVGDFGLARVLSSDDSIKTHTHGTVSHMPCELLEKGELGKATDIYSVGVLMWEMFSCVHAWVGQRPTQIFHRKVALKQELALPANAPAEFKALVEMCMSADPAKRPTADAVLSSLDDLLAAV